MFSAEIQRLIDSEHMRNMNWVARTVGGVADAQEYRAGVERAVYDNLWDAVSTARLHGIALPRFLKIVRVEWRDQERENPDPRKLEPSEEIREVWDGHD